MRTVLAIAALVLALTGCAPAVEPVFGKELYERSCSICHGLNGEGGIGNEIGTGSNTHLNLTDEQIAGVITVGPGNMPGFSRFTPQQVQSLVEYVRTLAR